MSMEDVATTQAGATLAVEGEGHQGRPAPWQERLAKALMARFPAFRSLLGHLTVFRILLAGSSISMLGSRISTIAFPVLVLHLNKSPFMAGLVTCAAVIPSMLVYLPAGALVDWWNPWRVMLVSEIIRGVAVASVVSLLLVSRGHVNIYLLIFFMVAEEILEIFWILADRRLMSQLLERRKIAAAQASVEARSHATVLVGRPLGPWLFAVNELFPFLADAISFAFSVGFLALVWGRRAPLKPAQKRHVWREIAEGFRWLKQNWSAGIMMGIMSFTTLIAQALIMMFLAEAHEGQLSTVAIGVVLGASGAGGAIGPAVARKLPGWIKRYWLQIQLCAWSVALALLAATGVRFSWCIAIVMLILGLTGSISNIEFGSYLVLKAGDKLARVTSIGQIMGIGACAIGPFLGGSAIQGLGVQGAVILFLCLVLMGAAVAFRVPRITGEDARDGVAGPVPAPGDSCTEASQVDGQSPSSLAAPDTSGHSVKYL
jgi:MFS family permease